MTGDEQLRAAAEEARQYLAGLVIHRQIDRDEAMPFVERLTRAIAQTYLAARPPADDGEAVTEEWLRSQGFVGGGLGDYQSGLWLGDLKVSHDGWWTIPAPKVTPETRGDVRRLCSVLGITLTESVK